MKVERDVYPVGRLDKDSEGLLILTNDKSLNSLLLTPSQKHKRSYLVQLDNDITDKAIISVSQGVNIKVSTGDYRTQPCSVKKLFKEPILPERDPPIRVRKNIPTSWVLIELTEGKNRQVRKMFAEVGFPVLRLVRVQIEDLKIGKTQPGKYVEIKKDELFKLLKIDSQAKVKKIKQLAPRPSPFKKTGTKNALKPTTIKQIEKKSSESKRIEENNNSTLIPRYKKKSDGHAPWQKSKPRNKKRP